MEAGRLPSMSVVSFVSRWLMPILKLCLLHVHHIVYVAGKTESSLNRPLFGFTTNIPLNNYRRTCRTDRTHSAIVCVIVVMVLVANFEGVQHTELDGPTTCPRFLC